ncbi:MAG: DUF262 domain-containing protein [Bacteroides sp.]|nr:DUF262 domain-containing protein [Bacteroides sp.]
MKTGRYNIAQLLTSSEVEQIIIPELQRDYVWGERNVRGLLSSILDNYFHKEEQTLCIEDIRGNQIERDIKEYLNEEYMRLRYNTRVGFIYAYHDMSLSSRFYLIDGQQRITTIFLVLLALYRRSDIERFRSTYFVASMPKIDYKVRETAHDFLVDFIEFELTKKHSSDKFRQSSKYYSVYDKDITAQSIYKNYYGVIVPMLASCDDVESLINYIENYIEFNYFDTNISEQGEKLYLYMNSRGESLSAQERIKSIIVGRSTDKLNAGKYWEDWQNFFWRIKPKSDKNADRGFYEFLKWAAILHMCKFTDAKVKTTPNAEKRKSRIEEIEDYIRIEKDDSAKALQTDRIFTYISENETFSFEWLRAVESAVEWIYELLKEDEFKNWGFSPSWFSENSETIEYVPLLGLLYYIVSFGSSLHEKINVLRIAMYLNNLRTEYTLRRNPDRAVIRTLKLIDWMSENNIRDIRLLGIYAQKAENNIPDRYVLRIDDLRWGYYLLDWQDSQRSNPAVDCVGRWEHFFWSIIVNRNLNRFVRGNHDFIIKVMQHGILSPEHFLSLFIDKIFNYRNDDNLRKRLLEFGDISVYDDGGSSNIGPNWMARWNLLGSNSDESYWDSFMNGKSSAKNAGIVASYLLNNQENKIDDPILKELGNNLKYMKQKYYLWAEGENQPTRIILLEQKQASKFKARELCVQYLHQQIAGSWIWEHNYCVINFKSTSQGLDTNVEDKSTGFYIDLWYDWAVTGGTWHCRIGHKEHDLSDNIITAIQKQFDEVQGVNCQWLVENSNRNALRTVNPIFTDNLDEDYFAGARFVKYFFDRIFILLNNLNLSEIL